MMACYDCAEEVAMAGGEAARGTREPQRGRDAEDRQDSLQP